MGRVIQMQAKHRNWPLKPPRGEFRGRPMIGPFPARKQIQSSQPGNRGGYDRFLPARQVVVLPAEPLRF